MDRHRRTPSGRRRAEIGAEEREILAEQAHRVWHTVQVQRKKAGERIADTDLKAWHELPDVEKRAFREAGEENALADGEMWSQVEAMRAAMGEKAFRQRVFEICITEAVSRIADHKTDAERYRAADVIIKLAGMLDVPDQSS